MPEYPEVRLTDKSAIVHSYRVYRQAGETAIRALIVRFSGAYGSGSAGNPDASYMVAVASAGLEAWAPYGLVFDLRDLRYTWGDRMESVLRVGRGKRFTLEDIMLGKETELKYVDIPTAVVVSDLCRPALESLLQSEMRQDPARWLFDSLDAAVAAVDG